MDRWVGKVAIVTGAASGIGAAIVAQLVERGLIIAAIDLHPEPIEAQAKLLKYKNGQIHAIKADVGSEAEIIKAFDYIDTNLGPAHILVNNAGYGKFGSLLDDDTEVWKKVLDTNVLGVCMVTREAIKRMKQHNIDGHIINTNSVLGHKVTESKFNVYPASKYAITALTETLRNELNGLGLRIKTTSVSPGLVKTGMTVLNKSLTPEWRALFEGRECLDPDDIADGVVYALSTPQHVQVYEVTVAPFTG